MADLVVGKYRLCKSENFDEFLIEIGLGFIKRKLAQSTNPEITISRHDDGEQWTMVVSSAISTSQITFHLGRDFSEERQDGVTVTSCIEADYSKSNDDGSGSGSGTRVAVWTQTQKPGDGKDVVIVREFTPTELRVKSTVGSVTSNRVYERI